MDIPAFIEIPSIIINTGNHRQSGRWCESPGIRDDVPRSPRRPASMPDIRLNSSDIHTCCRRTSSINDLLLIQRIEHLNGEASPKRPVRRSSSHEAPRYPFRQVSSGGAPRYPVRKRGFAVAA